MTPLNLRNVHSEPPISPVRDVLLTVMSFSQSHALPRSELWRARPFTDDVTVPGLAWRSDDASGLVVVPGEHVHDGNVVGADRPLGSAPQQSSVTCRSTWLSTCSPRSGTLVDGPQHSDTRGRHDSLNAATRVRSDRAWQNVRVSCEGIRLLTPGGPAPRLLNALIWRGKRPCQSRPRRDAARWPCPRLVDTGYAAF
jgi:hypothetical protein